MNAFDRRRVLRGMMKGVAVGVGVPLLDLFLDGNGQALANGKPLPVRFGTWHWGCGLNRNDWMPKKVGADFDLPGALSKLEAIKKDISILSGFRVDVGTGTNHVHFTGNCTIRTGAVPKMSGVAEAASFETNISEAVGRSTRFRSIDVSCIGTPESYSWNAGNVVNPSEISPAELYRRIFGGGFRDPNQAEFKPDPKIMATHSVLSAISEERQGLVAKLGSADRQRMDQYFTSLRQVEQQMAMELEKPEPCVACTPPTGAPDEQPASTEITLARRNHKLFTDLILMAVACDQTRVFNMMFSNSSSILRKEGLADTHHALTHQEPSDPKLGYQPHVAWFTEQSMEAFGELISAAGAIKEGDRTLLDSMLIMAHSDTELAKFHTVDGIPVILAGKAGGKIRTGLHLAGGGDLVTRAGLTCQQVMGVPVGSWGTGTMKTDKPLSELLI